MASSFTTNLRIELMADSENEDTWGAKANANVFEMFEDAISAESSISTTGGTTTLTTANGTADQSRNVFLDISGTLVSNSTIVLPAVNKFYLVRNGTSGSFTVTFKVSGQTGVAITQGESGVIYCDGTVTFSIASLSDTGYTVTAFAKTYLDDTTASATRTTLGLGTAATLNVGTGNNNVVQLSSSGKLPAVDGSDLTNLPSVAGLVAGSVVDYAGTSVPSGYLDCDGAAVSRTTYSGLFTAISTTWGSGDGSTTFNVPNLQRYVTVGSGGTGTSTLANTVGSTGGSETHTLIIGEMPVHTHSLSGLTTDSGGTHSHTVDQTDGGGGTGRVVVGTNASTGSIGTSSSGAHTHTVSGSAANTGSGNSHNNMQPSAVMLKIIKT